MDGAWFAFSTPDGLICALQKSNGWMAAAPDPRRPRGCELLVSSSYGGVAGFSSAAGNVFAAAGAAKPLPGGFADQLPDRQLRQRRRARRRCVDNRSQSGFVISPAGSFILNETPPLLYRPEEPTPFMN